jgi:integrase/recombinase XerC
MSDLVPRRENRPAKIHDRTRDHAELVQDFFGQYADNTLAAYRGDLLDFCDFLEVEEVHDAAGELLAHGRGHANSTAAAYRKHLRKRGLAPATINRRLAAMRSLASFAETTGLIEWTLKIKNVKHQAYRDTTGPGRDVVRSMIGHLLQRGDGKAVRDMAMLRLLYDLALRRSEVVSIDLEHLDLDSGRVQLRRKAKRGELVWASVPNPTMAAILAWVGVRGEHPGPLFTNLHRDPNVAGVRLTGRGLHKVITALGKKIGNEGVRPHGVRHTSVTRALDLTNGNMREVQKFSSHAKPETLMIYDDQRKDVAGEIASKVADDL